MPLERVAGTELATQKRISREVREGPKPDSAAKGPSFDHCVGLCEQAYRQNEDVMAFTARISDSLWCAGPSAPTMSRAAIRRSPAIC
jgi:hypothetical protein